MSSLRNAAPQKTHRERSQPLGRQHLGILEKHKDYKVRTQNYKKKQNFLKKLRIKALDRNPDEYYKKMIKTRTKDGVHVHERLKHFDNDTMKLLRSQDAGYINVVRNVLEKKIDKTKADVQFIGTELNIARTKDAKHTIFVDDEKQVQEFSPAEHFDTLPSLVKNVHNRLTKSTLSNIDLTKLELSRSEKKQTANSRITKYYELKKLMEKVDQLKIAAREAEIQKALMSKGPREKIGKDANGLPVYKWANERKR